jgi:hypothetical protein
MLTIENKIKMSAILMKLIDWSRQNHNMHGLRGF